MDLNSRIAILQEMHVRLNKEIEGIEKSKVFDDMELVELKKKRLLIKDEIAILTRQQFEEQHERLHLDDN